MREKNIDLIKIVAVFIVLLNHFGPILYNSNNGVISYNFFLVYRSFLSVAVPLLAISSGYLLIMKDYNINKIIKKIIHIFLLTMLYKLLYGILFGKNIFNFNDIIYNLTTSGTIGYRANSLWFMYALIGVYLLLPLVQFLKNNKKLFNYLCILVFIYPFILSNIELLFNSFFSYKMQLSTVLYPFETHYLFFFAYFLVGCQIKLNESKIKKINISYVVFVVLGSLALQAFLSLIYSNVSNELFDPMYNGYCTITCLVASLGFFYLLKYRLKEYDNKLLRVVANNSLGIYLLHWPLAYYIKGYIFKYVPANIYLLNFISSILIFLICLAISYLLAKNKYLRKLVRI